MAEVKKVAEEAAEVITKEAYEALKAENTKLKADCDKYANAVNKLITSMANRYAQDLAKEVLAD